MLWKKSAPGLLVPLIFLILTRLSLRLGIGLLLLGQLYEIRAIQTKALGVDNVLARGIEVELVESGQEILHDAVCKILCDEALVDPVVADKDTFAAAAIDGLRGAVGFNAGQNADVVWAVEVVAQVVSKRGLFMRPVEFPAGAAGVLLLRGTLGPSSVHVLRSLALTRNDKAR